VRWAFLLPKTVWYSAYVCGSGKFFGRCINDRLSSLPFQDVAERFFAQKLHSQIWMLATRLLFKKEKQEAAMSSGARDYETYNRMKHFSSKPTAKGRMSELLVVGRE
jgi:hypothetical protein